MSFRISRVDMRPLRRSPIPSSHPLANSNALACAFQFLQTYMCFLSIFKNAPWRKVPVSTFRYWLWLPYGPARQPECMPGGRNACLQRPHGPARQPTCMPSSQSACFSLPHGPSPASTEHSTSHLDKQTLLSRHAPVANG